MQGTFLLFSDTVADHDQPLQEPCRPREHVLDSI